MINIIKIEPLEDYCLKLFFSDGTYATLDFSYLLKAKTSLTNPLHDKQYFQSCFIDFGALCWKSGLELSADSLHLKAKNNHLLYTNEIVA
ncbi:MAG: DUF2442 domain-containing protein [Bacteroidales bacterium]|nr:DUF2442 domain-containing protein [Bacteroidales bacterium]